MTEDQALNLAEKLLALINSQPRTPSQLEIAQLIMRERPLEPMRHAPAGKGAEIAEEFRRLLRQGPVRDDLVVVERDRLFWSCINDPVHWNLSGPEWGKTI